MYSFSPFGFLWAGQASRWFEIRGIPEMIKVRDVWHEHLKGFWFHGTHRLKMRSFCMRVFSFDFLCCTSWRGYFNYCGCSTPFRRMISLLWFLAKKSQTAGLDSFGSRGFSQWTWQVVERSLLGAEPYHVLFLQPPCHLPMMSRVSPTFLRAGIVAVSLPHLHPHRYFFWGGVRIDVCVFDTTVCWLALHTRFEESSRKAGSGGSNVDAWPFISSMAFHYFN